MQMTRRSPPRAATASAMRPMRFSWNPSPAKMSSETSPVMQRWLKLPTLWTPIARSHALCSTTISEDLGAPVLVAPGSEGSPTSRTPGGR